MFTDFHSAYAAASPAPKQIIHQELGEFGISMIPGVDDAKAWSKEQIRDALAGFAEEFITQAVMVGLGQGKWDPADLGISTVSGAASGAISQNVGPIAQNWAELANVMLTAFMKNNLPIEAHPGGFMEGLAAALQVTQKAGWKMLIMAAVNIGTRAVLRKRNVRKEIHDDIIVAANVVIGKLIDMLIDKLFSRE